MVAEAEAAMVTSPRLKQFAGQCHRQATPKKTLTAGPSVFDQFISFQRRELERDGDA